jgi:sugar (pentulose or hexulose) kinase
LTADACGRRVVAGPVEATALGNMLVQAIATSHLPDISAGRQAIAASVDLSTFKPQPAVDWEAAFARFTALVQAS